MSGRVILAACATEADGTTTANEALLEFPSRVPKTGAFVAGEGVNAWGRASTVLESRAKSAAVAFRCLFDHAISYRDFPDLWAKQSRSRRRTKKLRSARKARAGCYDISTCSF